MARPVGQFDRQVEKCFNLISQLSGLDYCFATSDYLGSRLGVTGNQVKKYLKTLRKQGRIEVITSRGIKGTTNPYYRKRKMRPTQVLQVLTTTNVWMRRAQPVSEFVTVEEPKLSEIDFGAIAAATHKALLDKEAAATQEREAILEQARQENTDAAEMERARLELAAEAAANGW